MAQAAILPISVEKTGKSGGKLRTDAEIAGSVLV
jgi:hypothetical protein